MALAFEWVSKITTIVVEMVAPAWICLKLRERYDLYEHLPLVGLAIGFVVGMTHLLFMAKKAAEKNRAEKNQADKDKPS